MTTYKIPMNTKKILGQVDIAVSFIQPLLLMLHTFDFWLGADSEYPFPVVTFQTANFEGIHTLACENNRSVKVSVGGPATLFRYTENDHEDTTRRQRLAEWRFLKKVCKREGFSYNNSPWGTHVIDDSQDFDGKKEQLEVVPFTVLHVPLVFTDEGVDLEAMKKAFLDAIVDHYAKYHATMAFLTEEFNKMQSEFMRELEET